MRNHWTEIEKYLEDQKIAQELIGELRDFHMRYEVEAETEAAVEMMVVRHLSHVMRRSRFSRLRLTA